MSFLFFWIWMLASALLLPVLMLVFGQLFCKRPPRSRNSIYGYRTRRSMQSDEAWAFAHAYFGRLWRAGGLVLLPVSALGMLLCLNGSDDRVGRYGAVLCMAQLLVLLLAIPPTEAALKRNFDEQGKRRTAGGGKQ